MIVYEYVTADNGTIHVTRQEDLATKGLDAKTVCGRRIFGWEIGDETIACIETTCLTCKRIARPDLS